MHGHADTRKVDLQVVVGIVAKRELPRDISRRIRRLFRKFFFVLGRVGPRSSGDSHALMRVSGRWLQGSLLRACKCAEEKSRNYRNSESSHSHRVIIDLSYLDAFDSGRTCRVALRLA